MPSKPPRFVPTMALAVLWLALYFVWLAVRPTEPTTATQTKGRSATTSSTTPTTTPAFLKLKP